MNNTAPPTNIESEESILGGILLNPSAIGRVIDLLTPEAFYVTAHATIYRAALDLYRQDKPTELFSVKAWLSDQKLLRQVGGEAKLIQLLERTVSAVNIDHLASLVVDKYKRRELIAAGHELVKLGHDTTIELESVFDQSEQKIFNLTSNKQDQFKPKVIGDCLAAVFTKISQGSEPAYPTGLGDRSAGNRAQAVGKFSGAFKDIAKEFDVPFVALAQINRGVESQSNRRPGMADIKDSGDIRAGYGFGTVAVSG
jgi:replicative DNA helicase